MTFRLLNLFWQLRLYSDGIITNGEQVWTSLERTVYTTWTQVTVKPAYSVIVKCDNVTTNTTTTTTTATTTTSITADAITTAATSITTNNNKHNNN
jgi:hypothetical protein